MRLTLTKNQFYARAEIRPTGCWEWRGSLKQGGYGQVTHKGRVQLAHRLSYEFSNGPIPAGLVVCHTCDNRRCINPAHLWLGTQAQNLQDMFVKGRNPSRRKSRCRKGHLKDEDNSYHLKNGEVRCKTCCKASSVAHYHAKRRSK